MVDEFSEGPEISEGRTPTLLVVRKIGWWGSPKALVVKNPDEIGRSYVVLAGNKRVGFACGYHWNVWFRYSDGTSESINLNRECEHFQREPEVVRAELARLYERATVASTHVWLSVKCKPGVPPGQVGAALRGYGEIIHYSPDPYVVVVSPRQFSSTDLETIRGLTTVESVTEPKEYDTGT